MRHASNAHNARSKPATSPKVKTPNQPYLATSMTDTKPQLDTIGKRESKRRNHNRTDVMRSPSPPRYTHAGAEPGVNPRLGSTTAEYSHFKQPCVIDVIDYDSEEATFRRMGNADLVNLIEKEPVGNHQWPPRSVRWINIGGIDWTVLSSLALRYNLHSLALEDILHEQGHNHSKADYYSEHLFLRILCHTLDDGLGSSNIDGSGVGSKVPSEPVTEFPSGLDANVSDMEEGNLHRKNGDGIVVDKTTYSGSSTSNSSIDAQNQLSGLPETKKTYIDSPLRHAGLRKRFGNLTGFGGLGSAHVRESVKIRSLTQGERVEVRHEPLFIFLLRDGTVISIHPTPNLDYTSPISQRLHEPNSVLRTSEDASLLAQSLLDLVVDRILEVMDEYQIKIRKLEHDILLHPEMHSVRSLHILSGDLIMHKRTLDPIKTMIYGLRQYDLDRCMAIANLVQEEEEEQRDYDMSAAEGGIDDLSGEKWQRRRRRHRAKGGQGDRKPQPEKAKVKVKGYFSYRAKAYLADVNDHIDFALTCLDMFSGISENLINYAFNMASYQMSKVMKRLTLATIIFLPLTLLTGYFGMNFTSFWSVHNNSDVFFWKITLPVMCVLLPIFMLEDIRTFVRHMKQRAASRRAGIGHLGR